MELQIKHINPLQNSKPQFQVVRLGEGKPTSEPVTLPPPWDILPGNSKKNLREGLRWYLEDYLLSPLHTYPIRAEDVRKELKQWGGKCFNKLFGSGHGRDWYRDNEEALRLSIVSDDPAILAWPWEALWNEKGGYYPAERYSIKRQLSSMEDASIAGDKLPKGQLNILYIIARPFGDRDLGFLALARPLINFINEGGWPVHIDLLRPPTFARLQEALAEKPYHIVHFDGHGACGDFPLLAGNAGLSSGKGKFLAPLGALAFEKNDAAHTVDLISGEKLGQLLRQCNIPVMALNACPSSMPDDLAADFFASVAARLLQAGVPSVAALNYSVYMSGAKAFVCAFYRQLFESGNLPQAMLAGRQEMRQNNQRDTCNGTAPLDDWIVPILYQQTDENTLPQLKANAEHLHKLPEEALRLGDYGLIGRDRAILQLERALCLQPAGILIHGLAGEGKTTLAKGFLHWLEATNGLSARPFWFCFEDIHNAGYVLDALAGALFGAEALALPTEQKLTQLTHELKNKPFIIVWDNFESASGQVGLQASALLSEKDRELLKKFLYGLRGGKTKVLITSCSTEDWLSAEECQRLPLGGLQDEELWQYCNTMLSGEEISCNREGATYNELIQRLQGNPLAVRVILRRLTEVSAEGLLAEWDKSREALAESGESILIHTALAVFERGLDKTYAPALRLLGLHEHFADADFIGTMLDIIGETAPLADCLAALENAGLCTAIVSNIYQIHPALRDCLLRLHPATEMDKLAFMDVMGSLADLFGPKDLHEQRFVFTLFSANFHRALLLAQAADKQQDMLALTQGLAAYAKNTRNLAEAEKLYIQLAATARKYSLTEAEAIYYHQLGMIAQEQRDLDTAESRYQQSLEIFINQNAELYAASTYHNLGAIAQERQDFAAAGEYYKKSLKIKLKHGIKQNTTSTYQQLGAIAQQLQDFAAAEEWFKQSLEIELTQNNGNDVASTYYQLGSVAQQRQDFAGAESWYKQSLAIFQQQSDEHSAAHIYQQLGKAAEQGLDFDAAEGWYKKALKIELKHDNEHGAAITYLGLGAVAAERGDFFAAEAMFKQAFSIFRRFDDSARAETAQQNLSRLTNEKKAGDLQNEA